MNKSEGQLLGGFGVQNVKKKKQAYIYTHDCQIITRLTELKFTVAPLYGIVAGTASGLWNHRRADG